MQRHLELIADLEYDEVVDLTNVRHGERAASARSRIPNVAAARLDVHDDVDSGRASTSASSTLSAAA
jgi:hypothetical protein